MGLEFIDNEVDEIYEYIKSTFTDFYECPYGLCFMHEGRTVHVQFNALFQGFQHEEITFSKPYKITHRKRYICRDEPDDDDDDAEDSSDEFEDDPGIYIKPSIEDRNVVVKILREPHKHQYVFTDTPAGRMKIALCNANYVMKTVVVRTLKFFKSMLSKEYFSAVSDFHEITRLSKAETQWLVNELYDYYYGSEPVDLYEKNMRLGCIRIEVTADKDSRIFQTNKTRYTRPRLFDCSRPAFIIEPIYKILMETMDWDQHHTNDARNRRFLLPHQLKLETDSDDE